MLSIAIYHLFPLPCKVPIFKPFGFREYFLTKRNKYEKEKLLGGTDCVDLEKLGDRQNCQEMPTEKLIISTKNIYSTHYILFQ